MIQNGTTSVLNDISSPGDPFWVWDSSGHGSYDGQMEGQPYDGQGQPAQTKVANESTNDKPMVHKPEASTLDDVSSCCGVIWTWESIDALDYDGRCKGQPYGEGQPQHVKVAKVGDQGSTMMWGASSVSVDLVSSWHGVSTTSVNLLEVSMREKRYVVSQGQPYLKGQPQSIKYGKVEAQVDPSILQPQVNDYETFSSLSHLIIPQVISVEMNMTSVSDAARRYGFQGQPRHRHLKSTSAGDQDVFDVISSQVGVPETTWCFNNLFWFRSSKIVSEMTGIFMEGQPLLKGQPLQTEGVMVEDYGTTGGQGSPEDVPKLVLHSYSFRGTPNFQTCVVTDLNTYAHVSQALGQPIACDGVCCQCDPQGCLIVSTTRMIVTPCASGVIFSTVYLLIQIHLSQLVIFVSISW
jgi:hypothetical protein